MQNFIIYHNPRCSKSRQTLALIEANKVQVNIVFYLDNPMSEDEITEILQQLNLKPRDLLRKNESIYKEMNLSDDSLLDNQLITAMANNPKLIERPIVSNGKRAVIGRPPENILNLINRK